MRVRVRGRVRDRALPLQLRRSEADGALLDLVFLSCLMGSDYLPKVLGLVLVLGLGLGLG